MLYSETNRNGTMRADGPRNKPGNIDPFESDEIDLDDIPDDEFGEGWSEDDISDQPGGEDYWSWEELEELEDKRDDT